MDDAQRRAELAATVRRGSRPGGLARACLLVAKGEYACLDPRVSMAELRRLAARVREEAERGSGPVETLAQVLGESEGFAGAAQDYENPENSYLNRVLARRRGLPILLSVIWIEVARGAGLRASGIGLPGHFLVEVRTASGRQLVDPFERGAPVDPREALERGRIAAGQARANREWLRPVKPRELVFRVLANLASAYEQAGECRRLLRVVSDQLALYPTDPRLYARRGEALSACGDVDGALRDLNHALSGLPSGSAFERAHESARFLARLSESEN